MSTLQARIILQILLPAAMGGVLALVTRPSGDVMLSNGATRAILRPAPAVEIPDQRAAKTEEKALFPDSPLADQRRFCEQLQGASMKQMTALLCEAQTFADAFRRDAARDLVLEQMARTHPITAQNFMEQWENGDYQGNFLYAWARVDAEGALAWAERMGQDSSARTITGSLVPDDLGTYFKIFPQLEPEHINGAKLAEAFGFLAAEDNLRALKLFEGIAPESRRNEVASSLAEGWARRDAAGAYAWARTIADPAQRESALRGVFRAWAETDPQGVAAKLDELSKDYLEEVRGESPVPAVVRAWAAQDPKAAAAWWQRQSRSGAAVNFKERFATEILRSRDEWAATEVAEMLREPDDKLMTDSNKSPYGLSMMSSGDDVSPDYATYYVKLAYSDGDFSPLGVEANPGRINHFIRLIDPAGAFDELSKQPNDRSRLHVLEEVAFQWTAQDLEAVLVKLQQTKDEWLKVGLVHALANKARQNMDIALAEAVVKVLPEGVGSDWIPNLFRSMAQRDPARAKSLLDQMDPGIQLEVAPTLAAQQAYYDPSGAMAWAAQLTDEKLRTAATNAAFSRWVGADSGAASAWLTAQPAGPLREVAVMAMVDALQENSPEDAIRWAGSLADPQQREVKQVDVVVKTLGRDPKKAKELAANLQVSHQRKNQLQRTIQHREQNGN